MLGVRRGPRVVTRGGPNGVGPERVGHGPSLAFGSSTARADIDRSSSRAALGALCVGLGSPLPRLSDPPREARLPLRVGRRDQRAADHAHVPEEPTEVVGPQLGVARGPERLADYLRGFLRNVGMIGGALVAAADTEGKPGLAWRIGQSRERRAKAHAQSS